TIARMAAAPQSCLQLEAGAAPDRAAEIALVDLVHVEIGGAVLEDRAGDVIFPQDRHPLARRGRVEPLDRGAVGVERAPVAVERRELILAGDRERAPCRRDQRALAEP